MLYFILGTSRNDVSVLNVIVYKLLQKEQQCCDIDMVNFEEREQLVWCSFS